MSDDDDFFAASGPVVPEREPRKIVGVKPMPKLPYEGVEIGGGLMDDSHLTKEERRARAKAVSDHRKEPYLYNREPDPDVRRMKTWGVYLVTHDNEWEPQGSWRTFNQARSYAETLANIAHDYRYNFIAVVDRASEIDLKNKPDLASLDNFALGGSAGGNNPQARTVIRYEIQRRK